MAGSQVLMRVVTVVQIMFFQSTWSEIFVTIRRMNARPRHEVLRWVCALTQSPKRKLISYVKAGVLEIDQV